MTIPSWWFVATDVDDYHKPTCNWKTDGVNTEHCSCGLTRAVERISEPMPVAPLPNMVTFQRKTKHET